MTTTQTSLLFARASAEVPVAPVKRKGLKHSNGRMILREVRLEYSSEIADRTDCQAVTDPGVFAEALAELYSLRTDPQENLIVVTLDTRNRVLSTFRAFRGTNNACTVSPREILTVALLDGAAGIIVAHNHPSGDPSPSTPDVMFTRELREAAKILRISLVDHIVVGSRGKFASMAAKGMLS